MLNNLFKLHFFLSFPSHSDTQFWALSLHLENPWKREKYTESREMNKHQYLMSKEDRGAFTESVIRGASEGRRRNPSLDERDTEQYQSILALQAMMIHSAHGVHKLFLREVRGFRVFLGLEEGKLSCGKTQGNI